MSGRLDHTYELIKNDEAEKDQEFQLAISQWRTGFTITSYTRSNRAFEQVIQLSLDEDYASVRRALQNSSYRGDGNIRNLLSYAVQCGSLRRAQILIDNGCDVGQALMLLIRAGDTAGITNLLALKNFNIEAILNKPYLTPEGREEYPLEYLLHCEPTFSELRVDSSTIYDQLKANTRPDKAMYDRLIDAAIEGGNSRVLTSLLKQDPSYCSDDSLLIKLLSGDLKTTAAAFYPIARVLLDARILNAPVHKSVDESGNTPLHYVWGVKNAGDLPYECAYLTDDPKMALFMLLIRRGIDPFQTNVHNNKGFPYDPYDGTKSPAPLQYYNRYKEFVTTCNSGDQQKIDALFARYAHPGDNHQQTLIQFAQASRETMPFAR